MAKSPATATHRPKHDAVLATMFKQTGQVSYEAGVRNLADKLNTMFDELREKQQSAAGPRRGLAGTKKPPKSKAHK